MSKETKTLPTTMERRFIPMESAELRVAPAENGLGKTEGYVALFNRWSPVYGDFRERIAPEFFDEALYRDDVRLLRDHNQSMVLGRNRAGTLELYSDETGLFHRADLPDTTYARDLVVSMERKDVTGASFAFSLPSDGTGDEWAKGADGVMERTLLKAEQLFDVSVVTYPFYPDTSVAVRSLDSWRAEHDEPAEGETVEPQEDPPETEEVTDADEAAIEDLRRRLHLGR